MPTYIYETIPVIAEEDPVRFEVQQGINDPKLTEQPGTGILVLRIVSGGYIRLRSSRTSVGSVTDASWHQKD